MYRRLCWVCLHSGKPENKLNRNKVKKRNMRLQQLHCMCKNDLVKHDRWWGGDYDNDLTQWKSEVKCYGVCSVTFVCLHSSWSKMWQNASSKDGYFSLTALAEENEALESIALMQQLHRRKEPHMTNHHYAPDSRVWQVCHRQWINQTAW